MGLFSSSKTTVQETYKDETITTTNIGDIGLTGKGAVNLAAVASNMVAEISGQQNASFRQLVDAGTDLAGRSASLFEGSLDLAKQATLLAGGESQVSGIQQLVPLIALVAGAIAIAAFLK